MSSRPSRRPLARTLTCLAALALVVLVPPAPADASTGFQPDAPDRRIGGVDRFDTAARTALDAFPAGTPTALLANGWRNIDALTGTFLAGLEEAPILLTDRDAVPSSTMAALQRLGVRQVVVLGDENSVGDAALDQLEAAGIEVADVVAGEDRYDTAAQVYGSGDSPALSVFIARGDVPNGAVAADALAAGPAAFAGRPILLTAADSLPDVVADALAAGQPRYVTFLGRGISEEVKAEVRDVVPGALTQTIGGADRTETAAMLASALAPDVLYEYRSQVALANGYRVDALGAGVWAGLRHIPILLTDGSASLGAGTTTYLTDQHMTRGTVFGDETSVPQALAVRARELAHGGPAAPVAVTRVDAATGAVWTGAAPADMRDTDVYVLDETPVTRARLVAAAHVGDRIVRENEVPREGRTTWTLLTTAPTDWTDGFLERFDGGFAFIDRETNLRLRSFADAALPAGATFTVDGQAVSRSRFLADLNSFDELHITGTAFELANHVIDLTVTSVTDRGWTGSPGGYDVEFLYALPTDDDVIDIMDEPATAAQFREQLNVGDRIVDRRVGGVRRVGLANNSPRTFQVRYESGALLTSAPAPGQPQTAVLRCIDAGTGVRREFALGFDARVTLNGAVVTPAEFNAAVGPETFLQIQATDLPSQTPGRVDAYQG